MRSIRQAVNRIEERVATMWPGYKTKILLVLGAIAPVASLAGVMIDPEAVTAWIEQWWVHLMAVETAIVALAAWTRRLTDVYNQLTDRTSKKTSSDGGLNVIKSLAVMAIALGLVLSAGCASNMEKAANIIKDKDPRRCEVTIEAGMVQVFEGEDCTRVAESAARKLDAQAADLACNIDAPAPPDPDGGQISADEYDSYTRSFMDYAREKSRCASTVASYQGRQGAAPQATQSDNDTQLMIAAMNNDTRILSAWISQIPIVGQLGATYINHLDNQDYNKFLTELARGQGGNIGTVNVTKSDDGIGGEAPGTGGNGDQIVQVGGRQNSLGSRDSAANSGNRSNAFRMDGTGNVANDGEKPMNIAPGQNESVLDPSTVNNQGPGSDTPINNAPVVESQDNDGGGNSLLEL